MSRGSKAGPASRAAQASPVSPSPGFELEPTGRWEWGLLALGVVLRLLLQFPLHSYPGDADCVLTAIQATQVLDGDPAVFVPSGYRLGALNAYVTAASYVVFGVGRMALAAGAIAVGSLQMLLWWLATRELVGSRLARVVLPFILLPSPAVLEWGLHLPNANPEIFLVSTAVFWLGARLQRRGGGPGAFLTFGLAIGIAFWASILTLAVSIPTAIWVARGLRRREILLPAVAAAGGTVTGASPWLAFNIRYGWPSLSEGHATRLVDDWAMLAESLRHLWTDRILHLFTGSDGLGYEVAPSMPRFLLWLGAALLACGVFVAPITVLIRAAGSRPARERALVQLAFAIISLLVIVNGVSRMSLVGGISVRYLLPAALLYPPLLALVWNRTGERSRRIVAGLAVATLLFHLSAPVWPWTELRDLRLRELADSRGLAHALVNRGVDAVYGSYWIVYPLMLDSDRILTGVPSDPNIDFLKTRLHPLPTPARWAVVDMGRNITVISKRFERPWIEAGTLAAVPLDEGAGPSGHADSPELGEWYKLLELASRSESAKEVSITGTTNQRSP